jgi:hypothetical protein
LESQKIEFKTAVDTWFYWLVAVVTFVVAALVFPLAHDKTPQGIGLLALSVVLAAGVPLWVMRTTCYIITSEHLLVQLGAFQWTIPLDEIVSVRRIRRFLPGPAFSSDNLEIRYSHAKSIIVSPRERDRFMAALGVGTRLRGWG